jgi:hypothetical protein
VHTLNPQFDAYYNIFPGGFDGTWHGLLSENASARRPNRYFVSGPGGRGLASAALCRSRGIGAAAFVAAMASARPGGEISGHTTGILLRLAVHRGGFSGALCRAPGTFFALLVQSIRYLRRWEHHGRPVGIGLARVVVLFTIAVVPIQIAQAIWNPSTVPREPAWSRARAHIETQLAAMPGDHLVIVRYSPDHGFDPEFVFNRADNDHEKVIWAREIPSVDVRPLLDYFRGRHIWLFEPDVSLSQLSVYREAP